MTNYEKYNDYFCELFHKETQHLMECSDYEQLKVVKDIAEAWADLQCIEAGDAMREIARKKYGYDGDMSHWSEEDIEGLYNIFNAGGKRARDSRGRYMPMRGTGSRTMVYNGGYPYEMSPYNGGDMRDMRDTRDGRRDMYDDREPRYIMRQDGGKPYFEPYNDGRGSIPKKLTHEQYLEWVHDLANADGSTGEHWKKEQTKEVQKKHGMTDIDETAFWAAMNVTYSDLCHFFKKHNIDNADAYAEYVVDFWFEDEDAVGGGADNAEKLAAYYHSVVEH